jgi:16S rRNA (uracil1498-N3)-methyltransferase
LEAFLAGNGEPGGDAGLADASARWQLSLAPSAMPLRAAWNDGSVVAEDKASTHILILSGPEGGLSTTEQEQALKAGYQPVSLGPRTLRADTAPLAALAALGVLNSLSRAEP